ncbi:3291_t:CDS:2, partial [Paraglomus occultum]
NPPESLLTQINVYEEEYQDDLDEFHIKVHDLVRDPSDPTTIILDLLRQVEYDQSLYPRVVNSLKNMLRIACQDTRESFQDEIWTMVEIFLDRFTTISNIREEWQDFLRDYHDSIEHIVGKYHFTNLELIDEE